jgi:hypothetical protein
MSSSAPTERLRDVYSNDEEGRLARCKNYAVAARAALRKTHRYFPLMMVRRDSKAQQDLDFDATLLLEIARKNEFIPSLDRTNIDPTLERLPNDLRTITDDEALIATAVTLLERMFWVDDRLNLDGGMSEDEIMQIVEEFHVVSACIEADMGRSEADPDAEHDGVVEELLLSGMTPAETARECSVSERAVETAMERLYPWHALCCPVLRIIYGDAAEGVLEEELVAATDSVSLESADEVDGNEDFWGRAAVDGQKPPVVH